MGQLRDLQTLPLAPQSPRLTASVSVQDFLVGELLAVLCGGLVLMTFPFLFPILFGNTQLMLGNA